ncbi:protein SHQ1 homolog [Anthonomus grandis grandis]|uniref:protein SHQ1 homolog n=1 Tax=Anthonomus grandis grandis TaxID=2921223 RepID=UPI0021661992|nr:protein SHQ1 homolog [Anthonomus grandis grandis]
MILPKYKLTQDDEFVTINIQAPYCSLGELDVDIDGNTFLFVCKPYYLRLTLPGQILDDDRMRTTLDTDSGEFSHRCPKKNKGEYFKDLDLITNVVTPSVEASYNDGSMPIEILSESQEWNSTSIMEVASEQLDDVDLLEFVFIDNDGSMPIEILLECQESMEVPSEEPTNEDVLEYGFGFGLRVHKNVVQISSEFDEVFAIDPCKVGLAERRNLRLQHEQEKFNDEHYLADFIENEEICELIAQKFPLVDDEPFYYTDNEFDFLKDLPNIQYNLSLNQINYCFNGLADILFAYCYDQRITNYEGNVESGWTITKLAATLNWLDAYQTPKEAFTAAFRRSVIYPLYRNFDLSQKVFDDVKQLLKINKKYIIKVLIHMYHILCDDCGRHILNKLFVKDYIIYMMKWDSSLWKLFVSQVLDVKITKDDLGLNLTEIETSFVKDNQLAGMIIRENVSDSDDDSDCSSEDSSDDASSSEYTSDSDSDTEDSLVIQVQQTAL